MVPEYIPFFYFFFMGICFVLFSSVFCCFSLCSFFKLLGFRPVLNRVVTYMGFVDGSDAMKKFVSRTDSMSRPFWCHEMFWFRELLMVLQTVWFRDSSWFRDPLRFLKLFGFTNFSVSRAGLVSRASWSRELLW